jgi:hypothetical protein
MKFSATVAAALAPVALARNIRNQYPGSVVRRSAGSELQGRTNHVVEAPAAAAPPAVHVPAGMVGGSHEQIIIIWANPGGNAATTTVNEKVTVTQTIIQHATAPPAHVAPPAAAPPAHVAPPAEAPPAHVAPPAEAPPAHVTPPAAEHPAGTAPAAPGATHTVTVGGPGGLIFQPDQLNNVPVGDFVVFEFLSQNHTVTQSPFDTPCKALEGGMDSGFMANPNNTVVPPPQIALQVMAEAPLWFYCKAATHCGKGMTFSINPTAEKTQAQFQALAIAQNGTGEASPITGGVTAPPPPAAGAPAAPAPPAAAPPALAPGQGVVQPDGSCSCMASCSFDAGFPAVGAQGAGASGGYGGSLPVNMAGLR